jgi:hypothetical protein
MAYPIDFQKSDASRWLDALASGEPLTPPDGEWNVNPILALAGTLHFAAMSHGPLKYKLRPDAYEKLPAEHREATEDTFYRDLDSAIRFYSQLTLLVRDGRYDEACESSVRALVYQDDDGMHVVPFSGFKGHEFGG